MLCDNMKYQIISRAFYGWLAYCRHLSTVRTHLSALVNHTIVDPAVPHDAYNGLTTEVWHTFLQNSTSYEEKELQRLVYFGGVEPSLRKEVWPFLLGHYQFGMAEDERKEVDEQVRLCYQQTMSEWQSCEEIIRQREKEQHAVALAKCSTSGASMDSSSQRIVHHDSTVSNESSQSSDRQSLARLQSDSSNSTQVFESVEEVEQIETEPRTEEPKLSQQKITNGALQNGTSSPDSGHPSSRNFSVTSGLSDGSLSTEDSAHVQAPQSPGRPQDAEDAQSKGKEEGEKPQMERQKLDTREEVMNDAEDRDEGGMRTEESANAMIEASELVIESITEADDPGLTKAEGGKDLDLQMPQSGVAYNELHPTTESDESPSAIEMEEIPKAKVAPWSGTERDAEEVLAQAEEEKPSPEGTESILSDEPEMESICPRFDDGAEEIKKEESTEESAGSPFSQELLDLYTLNLHRIDKDVQRCDRNYWYFTPANLEKLRNIMCSYIWRHLDIGYVQGMCDLLAPLLVILDDEALAFSCFTELMKRMNQNFPHGGAMDMHFANMRSLIQILDSELFELMHQNGDYTHFYFCYRWFLLDFKRELVYDDVFSVWETIWAAKCVSSSQFVLFIALALVEIYRDIILENNMDFTDIIKFFNEMAEHHNIKQILTLARDLVCKVQMLIENK